MRYYVNNTTAACGPQRGYTMTKSHPRLSVFLMAMLLASFIFPVIARATIYVDQSGNEYWVDEEDDLDAYQASYVDSSQYESDVEDTTYTSSSTNGYGYGIDVSDWNGKIDWEAARADGVSFAILRCGGSDDWGGCYEDTLFEYNASECERLGIPYGVYFYSTADTSWEAAIEAESVLSTIAGYSPTLPVFLDLECYWMGDPSWSDVLDTVAGTFTSYIEYSGYTAGVYASASWWHYLLTDEMYDYMPRWVAQYGSSLEIDGATFWQSSANGSVAGISTPVDINWWVG